MENILHMSEKTQGVRSGKLVELTKSELTETGGGFFGAFLAGLAAGYLAVTL